jgi:hypothetical protein
LREQSHSPYRKIEGKVERELDSEAASEQVPRLAPAKSSSASGWTALAAVLDIALAPPQISSRIPGSRKNKSCRRARLSPEPTQHPPASRKPDLVPSPSAHPFPAALGGAFSPDRES